MGEKELAARVRVELYSFQIFGLDSPRLIFKVTKFWAGHSPFNGTMVFGLESPIVACRVEKVLDWIAIRNNRQGRISFGLDSP